MHSFVSSSAGSATLFPQRNSRSGSITTFNQRRYSKASDHLRNFSVSGMAGVSGVAATTAASNVVGKEGDKGDKTVLVHYRDPVLARTVTVEESCRRMEVMVVLSFLC